MELIYSFGNGVMRMVEMLVDKMRVNVLLIALLIYALVGDFGERLINIMDKSQVSEDVIITVLVALISTGVGGLIAAMVRMFESPSVPADVHERLMRSRDRGDE